MQSPWASEEILFCESSCYHSNWLLNEGLSVNFHVLLNHSNVLKTRAHPRKTANKKVCL